MKKPINIRMDSTLLAELDAYAEELERSRTYLIEKAVSGYFDTLDEAIADKRIDALKSGASSVISMEEVFKKAGLNV
ncbi:MAG: ribbon-helix-helix protein, CopG family [Hydrogenovibrio sp.]